MMKKFLCKLFKVVPKSEYLDLKNLMDSVLKEQADRIGELLNLDSVRCNRISELEGCNERFRKDNQKFSEQNIELAGMLYGTLDRPWTIVGPTRACIVRTMHSPDKCVDFEIPMEVLHVSLLLSYHFPKENKELLIDEVLAKLREYMIENRIFHNIKITGV